MAGRRMRRLKRPLCNGGFAGRCRRAGHRGCGRGAAAGGKFFSDRGAGGAGDCGHGGVGAGCLARPGRVAGGDELARRSGGACDRPGCGCGGGAHRWGRWGGEVAGGGGDTGGQAGGDGEQGAAGGAWQYAGRNGRGGGGDAGVRGGGGWRDSGDQGFARRAGGKSAFARGGDFEWDVQLHPHRDARGGEGFFHRFGGCAGAGLCGGRSIF